MKLCLGTLLSVAKSWPWTGLTEKGFYIFYSFGYFSFSLYCFVELSYNHLEEQGARRLLRLLVMLDQYALNEFVSDLFSWFSTDIKSQCRGKTLYCSTSEDGASYPALQ